MNINRNNYEAYFLDYHENNLNPEQVAELMVFLEQNPDLNLEFESFENIRLNAEKNIRFEHKETLKKKELIPTENIHYGNYEDYMVASLEGDLNEDDELELKAFISLNPKARLEYNFFRQTILKPDAGIVFSNKENIKKTGILVMYRKPLTYAMSIAAAVVILIGLYFTFIQRNIEEPIAISTEQQAIHPDEKEIAVLPDDDKKSTSGTSEGMITSATVVSEPAKIKPDQNSRVDSNPRMELLARDVLISGQYRPIAQIQNRNNESITVTALQDIPGLNTAEQKPFVSRFLAGLTGKVIRFENPGRKSILEYTIKGYNLMADKNVSLEKEVDKTGKVIAYSLDGESLSFFRNRSQQKE